MPASEQIARLRISLEGIEPAIWRQVEVPLTATLKAIHDVIQGDFGPLRIGNEAARELVGVEVLDLEDAEALG